MPAGTIALTNNSTTVSGNGTAFTSELKENDFIVAVVGGVTYTLGVKSVNSNSDVTLITKYDGPAVTGSAWTPVPNAALVGITAQVAADVAKAIRGYNLDKANWQGIYSNKVSVTVTLPDLSTYTGPSWGYIANQFSSINTQIGNRLDKAKNLSDVSDKAEAWKNIARYGVTSDTAARGDDARLSTIDGKTGGTVSGTFNKLDPNTINRIEGNLLIPSLSQNAITLWNTTSNTQNVWINWYRAEGLNGWRMGRQDGGSLVLACDQVGNTAMVLGVNDKVYSTANTTKASDGTLKAASPIARIVASKETTQRADVDETGFDWCGCGTANAEAEGISIKRFDTGIYILTGSAGLAKEGWQLLPPRDPQGSGDLGIVEAEETESGGLKISLYKRRYRLNDENGDIEVAKGDLIDVPVSSWIDVRLDMPEDSIFNLRQKAMLEAAENAEPESGS
ncbi:MULTISPECIES: phage tail fiber protein [Pantoea]|uniref:phage tail fiber protein n=1 Tax=Pantoea TaxID=53335 RepID=UPI002591A21E|nr:MULTISPECIES: hypothetical protein [Pantoea]